MKIKIFNMFEAPEQKSSHQEYAERIERNLGVSKKFLKNKKTLDVGAGDSSLAECYKDEKDISIIAIDIKEPKLKTEGFVRADATQMPFEDESFDLILSMGGPVSILEDREQVEKIIKEIKRVLKSGGEARIGQGYLNANIFEPVKKDLELEQIFKFFRGKSLEFLQSFGFKQVEEVEIESDKVDKERDYYYRLVK